MLCTMDEPNRIMLSKIRVVIVIRTCSLIYKGILFFICFFFFHFTPEFIFRPFFPFKLAHAYFQFVRYFCKFCICIFPQQVSVHDCTKPVSLPSVVRLLGSASAYLDVIHKLYILYKTCSSFMMSYELCLYDMRVKSSWSLKSWSKRIIQLLFANGKWVRSSQELNCVFMCPKQEKV